MHRLDLGLYSHPKEFWGDGVRTHVGSKGKIPSTGKFSPEEDRSHNVALSRTASPVIELNRPGFLLLVRQMEAPVSSMKVAVHRKSLRLPYSLRATGVWSGQIPFLSGSQVGQDCSRCSVV